MEFPGALYQKANYLYEGDTPTYMNLIDNGLTDPSRHWYGGWGGRFDKAEKKNVRSGAGNNTFKENQYDDYSMLTDATDTWKYGSKTYSNVYCGLFRWRTDFQNDFAARMDWSYTSDFGKANHNPVAVIQGDKTRNILHKAAPAGSILKLDATGSKDPDGNALDYSWWVYGEAGTYDGKVAIDDASKARAMLNIPSDAECKEIHVILTLRDNGTPALSSYRRLVVTAIKAQATGLIAGRKQGSIAHYSNPIAPELRLDGAADLQ